MKANLWGNVKKTTAIFTIFTQVFLPVSGADVIPVEFQDQGIPTIAADKVVPSQAEEVPRSLSDAFFAESNSPLSESSVQKHSEKNDAETLDAVSEGIWKAEHTQGFLEIMDLEENAIKGIEITQEERNKVAVICQGPGCAVSYEVTVQLNDERSFTAHVSYSWDHQWAITVLDSQDNIIGERHGSASQMTAEIILYDEYYDEQGRVIKESRDGAQFYYHHSDTGVERVKIVDRDGNTTQVVFEIQGMTVPNARKAAVAAWDLIERADLADGALIYLTQFSHDDEARVTLRTGLTFYHYRVRGRKAVFLSQESAEGRLERLFSKASAFVQELQGRDRLTLQEAQKMNDIQARLKALIEILPKDQWPAWTVKFNQYLDASDYLVATKSLSVILKDGRELVVRNHTDLFSKIIQRFKMMDQTGEINLSRLAGIDDADLKGLETFSEYITGRQIGEGSGLPLFDLSSPHGNLELIDRLVRKYAAEEGVIAAEGPVDVVQEKFLRYVDGTQQAFDGAMRLAKNIMSQYPVRSPSTPLTVESILAAFNDLETLNSHLSREIAKALDLFQGEAVFKNLLINNVTAALGGNDYYRPVWERVIAPLNKEDVIFNIQGKDIRVTRAELDSFTNRLPSDTTNLSRYPGVKSSIDSSFFATVMTQGYYSRLASVDLRNPAIPPVSGTGHVVFSNVARRFQILEQFLKTWPEVIRSNNTVDFDRLRFRLLISYELEIALGRAEEYLNGRIQAMQAFGDKKVITVEDYAAMKDMLSGTQAELALRFNPLLKDVIYDTTNEVTSRIQTRFQGLVNSFASVLSQVKVTVKGPNGDSIVFDPKMIQNDVLNKILNASAIRVNGHFPREAFLRITGIDESLLSGLLSPEKLANLKNFTFYQYNSTWQGPGFANEEILFVLIPALVQMFETADVQDLTSKMTEGMSIPVTLGESIETSLKNSAAAFVSKARADINAIDLRTLKDVYAMKAVFEKLNRELRALVDQNHDGVTDAKDFSVQELAVLESWINWNWSENGIGYLSSYSQVDSLFQSKINSVSFLEVEGVRVPLRQILAIAGFPSSSQFNRVLFPGLETADFEDTESYSELSVYQSFRFAQSAVNPNDFSLSPLGRIEAAVHIAARLILSLDPAHKVFFVNAQGGREIDPNEFRKYIKGVEAMRQAILEETRARVAKTALQLEAMRKGSYALAEIEALHAKLLGLRSDLIQVLKDNANIHERQDVLSVENEVSQIFQKGAFELFVSIVGAAKLTVEINGQSIVVPAKAITDALIAYLKTQKDGAIAAHDFATLYGISVADVRSAHKLENYLSEQIVALPKNSEYVQIVSQISELGYMQLASQLVKRYAKEVLGSDGTVDVARLVELVTDKELSVAQIKQAAVEFYELKARELYDAVGQAFGVEGLNAMTQIMEDTKGSLVSMMNDFLSGNSDDALLKDLEELVNKLHDQLKKTRDSLLEKTPFVYEVNGRKISVLLNKETVVRFGQAVADWLAANPAPKPTPIWPILGGGQPLPISEEYLVLDQPVMAVRAVSLEGSAPVEFASVQKPIGIWLPFPEQGNYNPGDHPTEFGLATLFARLAVKYSEFAVDENGFNMGLFLAELQSTDASRAERRLQNLLEAELPALKDFIRSLRQNGALPVEKIGEINGKFEVLKERIRVLGNEAQSKSIEVWQAFVGLYESALFEESLSVEVNGKKVVFEPKVLNDILLKLHKENKLDPTLMKKFNEKITNGESTWQYQEFKSMYVKLWYYDSFGFSPRLHQTFEGLKDEAMDSEKQKVSFTLGEMVRLPGISAKDLNGLDVIEKDSHLRLTPVDPLKLLGLLDMRALAPGSGVSTGGLMAASMSADSMLVSSMKSAPAEAMRVEIMPVDRVIDGVSLLTVKSYRFVVFDLIPAMIKEMGDDVVRAGEVVVPAYFSLALEGKLADFLNQRSDLLKAADDEIRSLEASVKGLSASILTAEQLADIEAQIKEQVGSYAALSKNLQEVLEHQGVSSETRESILSFLKLQSEGGKALSEAALTEKTAQFMEALTFNNQQRQFALNITRAYAESLKEYRAKIAAAETFEELMIPKPPMSLAPSAFMREDDPRGFLESSIADGTLLLDRARLEIKNWKPPVHKSVLIKQDLSQALNQWKGYQLPKSSLLSEKTEESEKDYSVFRTSESQKKKNRSSLVNQRYEDTVVVLQPLKIAGTAASDAAMETWMAQLARGIVPDQK